jgi:hypothetical protein
VWPRSGSSGRCRFVQSVRKCGPPTTLPGGIRAGTRYTHWLPPAWEGIPPRVWTEPRDKSPLLTYCRQSLRHQHRGLSFLRVLQVKRRPTSGLEPLTPAPATSLPPYVPNHPGASGDLAYLWGFRRIGGNLAFAAYWRVRARLHYGCIMLCRAVLKLRSGA